MLGLHKHNMPHFLQLARGIRFLAVAEKCLLHLASEVWNGVPGLTSLFSQFPESLIYALQDLLIQNTKNRILLWCVLIEQLYYRYIYEIDRYYLYYREKPLEGGTAQYSCSPPFAEVGIVGMFWYLDLHTKENTQTKYFDLDENKLKTSHFLPNKAKNRRQMEHLKVFHEIRNNNNNKNHYCFLNVFLGKAKD